VFLEWVRELSIEGLIAVFGMGKSKGDQLLYLLSGEGERERNTYNIQRNEDI
jgi:hypothetical protein